MIDIIVNYIKDNQLNLLAFFVGFITLIYTIRLFYMKKGINVRCSYSFASSRDIDDTYLHNFILENRKDKSIVIFHIYLKLGNNYYLELENFENNPLIIKPFEVYLKNFSPVIFYSVSMSKINLNKLLNDRKVKKKIVIYTTEGINEIKAHVNIKHPISLFFKNYYTAVIIPNRIQYNNSFYGKSIKFLVNFIDTQGLKETIYIRKDSTNLKIKNLEISSELIENKEKLESFFQYNLENKKLKNIIDVNVIDMEDEIKKLEKKYEDKILDAEYLNFFQYYVIGKFITIIENMQIKLKNYFRNNSFGIMLKKIIFCKKHKF